MSVLRPCSLHSARYRLSDALGGGNISSYSAEAVALAYLASESSPSRPCPAKSSGATCLAPLFTLVHLQDVRGATPSLKGAAAPNANANARLTELALLHGLECCRLPDTRRSAFFAALSLSRPALRAACKMRELQAPCRTRNGLSVRGHNSTPRESSTREKIMDCIIYDQRFGARICSAGLGQFRQLGMVSQMRRGSDWTGPL